jgi:predicted RNase H-like nuclease
MPAFVDGGRARRLTTRLGLGVDPASTADRRAIEVYPHPAIVMLFGLDRVLRSKNKRGRSQVSLRTELLRLIPLVEDRTRIDVTGSRQWRAIRAEVEQAATKAQLKRAEGRVDAVLCVTSPGTHEPRWHARRPPTGSEHLRPVSSLIPLALCHRR